MQAVDTTATTEDQTGDDHHLHHKTREGCEADDVIHRTEEHHHRHTRDDRHQIRAVHQTTAYQDGCNDSEEHTQAAHHRDRHLLQLACIRVIHQVLLVSDSQHLEVDPEYRHHRDDAWDYH